MGNILIEDKGKSNPMKGFDAYIDQNPELVQRGGALFENKIFRTLSYKANTMNLLVKVHLLRKQMTNLEMILHESNFLYMIKLIGGRQFSNLLPFQKLINFTEKQQYQPLSTKAIPSQEEQAQCNREFLAVCRQQLHTTLFDKLQSQSSNRMPICQKHFIAMQIILAIHTLHQLKLYHGYIRTSNILLNSSDHVVLADMATYKPYYLRENELGEFTAIYQSSILQCTLAPEKFLSPNEPLPALMDLLQLPKDLLKSLQQMDMFSVGVVIAELYLGGKELFTFEQLMQYRNNDQQNYYDPAQKVKQIDDLAVQELILNLLSRDPQSRFNSQSALQFFFDRVIVEKSKVYQWLFYLNVANSWSYMFSQPDFRIALIRKIFVQILAEVCGETNIPKEVMENGVTFQYSPPIPLQKVPVVTMFNKFLNDSDPKLFTLVKGLEKIVVQENNSSKFSSSFKPGTSAEFLLSKEPFENVANLQMQQFIVKHQVFAKQEQARESQELMKMSQIQRLRNSINILQQRSSQQRSSFQQQEDYFLQQSLNLTDKQQNEPQSIYFLSQLDSPDRVEKQQLNNLQLKQLIPMLKFESSDEANIVVQMICSQLQNLRFTQTKLCALELLEFLSRYQTDLDNYYLTLPQIGALIQDNDNSVVQLAFAVFIRVLKQLKDPFATLQEVKLWRLYFWGQILKMLQNEDIAIQRIAYERIGELAEVVSTYERNLQKFAEKVPDAKSDPMFQSNLENEFFQNIKAKLETQKNDIQDLIISNLGQIFLALRTQIESENIILMLVSHFNNPLLKFSFLKNLPQIFSVIQHSGKDEDLILACLDVCLLDTNELQLFYTVRFFNIVAQLGLMSKEKEIKYLRMIAPFLVFPNLWIRDQAIGYAQALLQRYSAFDMFSRIQPVLVNYLKEDISFLNPDILQMIVGDMINRQIVDFKTKKVMDINSKLQDRDKFIIQNFIDNYLNKVKQTQIQEREEKEEKLQFQRQIEILYKRHDLEVTLGKRINEFIVASFKSNLFYYGEEDTKFEEQLSVYKQMQTVNNNTKITEDQQIQDILEEKKLHVKIDNITNSKLKKIQAMHSQYQSNLSYLITQKNILSQLEFRNLTNAILIINQIEVKARQIGIKEDFSVKRVTTNPPPNRQFKSQQQLVTTISEHKDIVSTVQNFRDQRFFLSGSHDGTVRLFDMSRIDQDFTAGSVACVKCVESEDKISHKVVSLKPMEFTDSFLVGTNTGFIELYKIDHHHSKSQAGVSQLRQFRRATSDIKKIETMQNEFSQSIFVYVTSMGEIVVEDIRSRSQAITFSVGKERGLVTGMIQRQNSLSTCISTMNGYCMVYDLRCNLISNVFQLLGPDDHPLPIFSMANFKRETFLEGVDPTELVAIGFQSNNNEVGFWNLNDLNENVNPSIYVVCSDKRDIIVQNPRLKNLYKNEQFKNFSNTLEERSYYDFVGSYHQMDLINYLKDPLTNSQNQIKERWLINTKNCYANMKTAFEAKSSVTNIITLPYPGITGQPPPGKPLENTIITASTDRCVQSWTLVNDMEKQYEKEQQGSIICQPWNYYDVQRRFTQVKSGDVYVIHDFEPKLNNQQTVLNKEPQIPQSSYINQSLISLDIRKEYKIDHKDCITDMTYLEREQGVLITASRDQTIKIWK